MKISGILGWCLFVSLGLAACGSGKYGDVKAVMDAQARVMENYIDALARARNTQDVVAAIHDFTRKMKELIPDIKKTLKKYPELSERLNPPEELKAQTAQMRELSARLQATTMKTMPYMQDAEVQAAMQEQRKVMMELAKE